MEIPVIYVNGQLGRIQDKQLDELLEMRVIIGFCRSSGWVKVGRDELRSSRVDEKGSWRDRKSNRLLLRHDSNNVEKDFLLSDGDVRYLPEGLIRK
ncbi:MAG TPA: hypothetical protein VN642_04655 [Dongiaceae bacterium]|nr:hypothetical protein [Dongiaceae bacterium]